MVIMTFPIMCAWLIHWFTSSLNFDWIPGMSRSLCSLLCYNVRWGPGPRRLRMWRRGTPNSEQLEQCSSNPGPWEYLGCLLSMPFPGPSQDLPNENCWKQGRLRNLRVSQHPQVTSTHMKIRRLTELGQMGQPMMKCKIWGKIMWPEKRT